MKSLLAALVILALASAGRAHAADAAEPERLAEARAILAATHMDKQVDGMAGVMADGMAKQFAQAKPGVDPRIMQVTLEESMRGIKDQMRGPGGLMEAMANAYASQFSFAELRQIREFYESQAGQHMLLATPELMKQVFPKIAETARLEAPRSCARAKERLLAEKVEGASAMTCPPAP